MPIAMVAFILASRLPNGGNLRCKCVYIGRTTPNFKKIKILSYAAESWTQGVFSDGDSNMKLAFSSRSPKVQDLTFK